MKLKSLLIESPIGNMPLPPKGVTDNPVKFVDEYVDTFVRGIAKRYKIEGWTADLDQHSGSLMWSKDADTDLVVLATPFWEMEASIPLDVMYDGDEKTHTVVPFKPTYNLATDSKAYVAIMKRFFSAIINKYNKQ